MLAKAISKINNLKVFQTTIILFILVLSANLLIMDNNPLVGDTAEYLNNSLRVVNGDKPYIDFWFMFSPGEVHFPAFIIKLFGHSIDTVRIVTLIFSSFVIVALYLITKKIFSNNLQAIFASIIAYLNSICLYYEGPDFISLYLLMGLSAVYLFMVYLDKKEKYLIFIIGVISGLVLFFRIFEGGAIVAAIFVSIILDITNKNRDEKRAYSGLIIFLMGLILSVSIWLIPYYSELGLFINNTMIDGVKNGTSVALPYFWDVSVVINSIEKISLSPIFAIKILKILLYIILYLLIIIVPILFFTNYKNLINDRINAIAILLFMWGIFSFPKALGRSDIAHLVPYLLPFCLLLFLIYFNTNKISFVPKKVVLIFILMLSLSLAVPLINFMKMKSKNLVYLKTKYGKVHFTTEQEKNDFENTLKYIDENLPKKDRILFSTLWDSPPIYFLSNTKNPTIYDDGMNDLLVNMSETKQRALIEDLIKDNVSMIIHDPDFKYEKQDQSFKVNCALLQQFIDENYIMKKRYGKYHIYEKIK